MSNFLQFASRITATEYDRLQKSTPFSRLKVKALALTVFIPAAMWCIFGFLVSNGVMQNDWLPSAFVGIILGTIVFTIERLIVMGNGNWLMLGFRILLGATIAWLGAQLVDLVIFKADIDNKLPAVKHELAMQAMQDEQKQFNDRNNIQALENSISSLDGIYQMQQKEALDEAGGLKGTGIKGVAQATRFKQDAANKTLKRMEAEQEKLNKLLISRSLGDSLTYQKALTNISDQSILIRIKALEMLLKSESAMRHIYWGFTLLMFLLEFLVIIFKLTMKKSAYEDEVAAIEVLYKNRTQRLYGAHSPYNQPHTIIPEAGSTIRNLSTSLNTLL